MFAWSQAPNLKAPQVNECCGKTFLYPVERIPLGLALAICMFGVCSMVGLTLIRIIDDKLCTSFGDQCQSKFLFWWKLEDILRQWAGGGVFSEMYKEWVK